MFENVKSKKEILNKVYDACNTLRHVMDPSDYKDYILTMLFIKYISDLYEKKKEELRAEYGDNEELIKRKLQREKFVLDEDTTFAHIYSQKDADNIGEVISETLKKIENKKENYENLNGVFNVDFNHPTKLGTKKQKNQRLITLLDDFEDIDFKPYIGEIDIVGDVYEFLIGEFAADSGKKGGEFYTPPEVALLGAKVLQPEDGDTIYDPTCGSGSLLLKAADEVGSDNYSLYGQEVNNTTWGLAKMNMFLHEVSQVKLECEDTINAPAFLENDRIKKFNKILANPPFSKSKWGEKFFNQTDNKGKKLPPSDDQYKRFHRGFPPQSKGDWAFVTHMVESLKANGRAVIVVPHGVLFRGAAEGKIREKMIRENIIDAVVGLPSNLFFGTGIPAALLIIDKNKKDENILFVDASSEYKEEKKQNKLLTKHIDEIAKLTLDRVTVDKKSFLAPFEIIEENEFNLNISRYVDTFVEEEEIDIQKVQSDIIQLEDKLATIRFQMEESLKELGYEL